MANAIVKDLNFGKEARDQIFEGIENSLRLLAPHWELAANV